MHDQLKLQFPLLVDARFALARQFGLVYRVPEGSGRSIGGRSSTCRL
jgi:peroxiredoxin